MLKRVTQDKMWEDLSVREKEEYQRLYESETERMRYGEKVEYLSGKLEGIKEIFGEHNLLRLPNVKKYRNIPKLVEAIQYNNEENLREIRAFVGVGNLSIIDIDGEKLCAIFLHTPEGQVAVEKGDYIIKEGDKLYVYKKDNFISEFDEVNK